MPKDLTFKQESERLNEVVSIVRGAKNTMSEDMERIGAFNLEKLKELRENPAANAADFLQFLQLIEQKNRAFNIVDKYKRLEELDYSAKEPYFSRIDLEGGDKQEKYYIGKFGFTVNNSPLVLDWRSGVASVYYKYRFPQKSITYNTPDGKVTKDLTLKRTFEIDDGELLKYFNNDIKLDESEIIAQKIEGRTGGVLEDIVETIQEDQHEIIEFDPRSVCIVQGTVGSGKSTVAIHKLSYIFFNYPNLIKPEKAILIAKNQILVGYLSTLFPKLGIFDISYGTIRDVIYKLFFREEISQKFDLGKNRDTSDFGIKEIRKINKKLEKIHKEYEDKLTKIFGTEENAPFGGFVYDSKQSVRDNLTELIKDLEEERRYQTDFIKENKNHPRTELFRQNLKVMKKILKRLADLRVSIRSKALNSLLKELGLKEDSAGGYREALIFLLAYSSLIGYRKYEQFEYCVMDEGQDFSTLEYAVLNKLVRNGRFCILGDLNQSYAEEGLATWDEIEEVVTGAKEARKFVLDKNYRSTKPIVEFANKILRPYTDKYLPVPIERRGVEPTQITINNDIVDAVVKDLEMDVKNVEKSIGIICMNDEHLEKLSEILKELSPIKERLVILRETDRIEYQPRAIYLTHFDNCKGLEFGKVYVVGLDIDGIESFKEAKKAFVAVTRAMDDLRIYTQEKTSI